MATAEKLELSYAEYAKREAASDVRHEFIRGEVFAMAGGTIEHGALAVAITGILQAHLRNGPCRAFSADTKVRTRSGLGTYPDLTIVCGRVERDGEDEHSITNPTVLIEILSGESPEFTNAGFDEEDAGAG